MHPLEPQGRRDLFCFRPSNQQHRQPWLLRDLCRLLGQVRHWDRLDTGFDYMHLAVGTAVMAGLPDIDLLDLDRMLPDPGTPLSAVEVIDSHYMLVVGFDLHRSLEAVDHGRIHHLQGGRIRRKMAVVGHS